MISQKKDDNPNLVKNWLIRGARIDPDTDRQFQNKLKETGDSQSAVIRKGIRNYINS